ncbi:hypothetical protein Tco_0852441 [Tanacetum coccineum]
MEVYFGVQFHRAIEQGGPIGSFFVHSYYGVSSFSFNCDVEAGIFTGLRIDDALTISHLFYADDAIFIGEWSKENLKGIFHGIQEGDRKITWVKWHTVLAAKKFGGLGVSSFFALNRGLLAKWVWRFLSQDNSLWCQLISAIHGSSITDLSTAYSKETVSVACKLQSPLVSSFRRNVRGGIEEQQLEHLVALLDFVILSNSNDRWVSDLNGDGVFRVKDVRNLCFELRSTK